MTDDLATALPDEDAAPVFEPDDEPIDDADVDAADAPEG